MEFPGAKVDWIQSSDARMPTTEVISVTALRLHLLNIVSQGHQVFSSPELQNVEPGVGASFMHEGLSNLHHDRKCTLTQVSGTSIPAKTVHSRVPTLAAHTDLLFYYTYSLRAKSGREAKEMGRGKCLLPRAWCLFFSFYWTKKGCQVLMSLE